MEMRRSRNEKHRRELIFDESRKGTNLNFPGKSRSRAVERRAQKQDSQMRKRKIWGMWRNERRQQGEERQVNNWDTPQIPWAIPLESCREEGTEARRVLRGIEMPVRSERGHEPRHRVDAVILRPT